MKMRCMLIMLVAVMATNTYAWGPDGHAAVGAIADANLSPAAKTAVSELLKNDLNARGFPSGRTTLAQVASWSDEIRSTSEGRKDAHWHFRDNPLCESRQSECKNGGCVDAKILEMETTLKNNSASPLEKNEALKWLVHLVGDIHQPLHTASNNDSGGNGVNVALLGIKTKGRQTLHKVWDTALVKEVLKSGPITATLTSSFAPQSVNTWLQESHQLAVDVAYGKLPGFQCGAPQSDQIVVLDKNYQAEAETVIKTQLQLAGLRLAATLNAVFK